MSWLLLLFRTSVIPSPKHFYFICSCSGWAHCAHSESWRKRMGVKRGEDRRCEKRKDQEVELDIRVWFEDDRREEDMRQMRREDMRWNQESYYNNPLTTLDLQETVIEFLESARVGNGKSCFKTIINRNLPKKSQWGHLCSDPLLMTCWCRHWSFVRVRV